MLILLYWFRCPSGHKQLIDDDQKECVSSIICDQCDFEGYSDEGYIDGKYLGRDEMSHLRG